MLLRATATVFIAATVALPSLIINAPVGATTTPGPVTQLVFTSQPGNATGGSIFGDQPVVAMEDSSGNVVTTASGSVVLTVLGLPSVSAHCAAQDSASGVATFTDCKINPAAKDYQLVATSGSFTGTSAKFDVTVGAPAQVAFSQQPTSIQSGANFSSAPTLAVEDAGGNVVTTNTDNVGLAVFPQGASPLVCTGGEIAAPSGQAPGYKVVAVAGIAAFPSCTINHSSAFTFQLAAVATNETVAGTFAVTSQNFSVLSGSASRIAFVTSPSGATTAGTFVTQPAVAIQDAGGNTVVTATDTIALTLTPNTGTAGAALTCLSQPAVNGLASFSGCSIDTAGTGYTLTATDQTTTYATVTSDPFLVSDQGLGSVTWSTQPVGAPGGQALGTQPVVTLTDTSSNPISGTVQLSILGNPAGVHLACDVNPLPAGDGTATFSGCTVDKAGTYQLVATDTDSPTIHATSDAFSIVNGPAAQLTFVSAPTTGTGGVAFGTQPSLALEDLGGNYVGGAANSIALSVTSGSGTFGAALTCTASTVAISASTGVAAFANCALDRSGSNYTLSAVTSGFVATSQPFSIFTGTASKLVYVTQPSGGTVNTLFGTQPVVGVADAGGNLVGPASASISLSLSSGSLHCFSNPVTTNIVNGVSVFAGCKSSSVNNVVTMTASAPGLQSESDARVVTGLVNMPSVSPNSTNSPKYIKPV